MNYRRNSSGYYDPTAGAALEHIARDERRRRRRRAAQSSAVEADVVEGQDPKPKQPYINTGRYRRRR